MNTIQNQIQNITDDIFFLKKYILFFTYFMNMYPLGKNNTFLVNSIGECKCGNTKRMLLYLFGSRLENKITINNYKDYDYFKGPVSIYIENLRNKAIKENKHLMVDISLGAIDHTFVINFMHDKVYIYQSYIKINPLVITKLSPQDYNNMMFMIDEFSKMSTNVNNISITDKMMSIMVSLFGANHFDIKYLFDRKFSIDYSIYDRSIFYKNVIDVCKIYNEKFIKKNKYVTYEYKNTNYASRENQYMHKFYGNVLYGEYKNMINEMTTYVKNEDIENIAKSLENRKQY